MSRDQATLCCEQRVGVDAMDNADLSAAIRELTRELSDLRRVVERISSQSEFEGACRK